MPAANYYEVEQTRRVKVRASSVSDAMLIANREFAKESKEPEPVPQEELQGAVTSHVEVTRTDISKEL